MRKQFFVGILTFQIVFEQGLNPNQAFLMRGLAARGGQFNPATMNTLVLVYALKTMAD